MGKGQLGWLLCFIHNAVLSSSQHVKHLSDFMFSLPFSKSTNENIFPPTEQTVNFKLNSCVQAQWAYISAAWGMTCNWNYQCLGVWPPNSKLTFVLSGMRLILSVIMQKGFAVWTLFSASWDSNTGSHINELRTCWRLHQRHLGIYGVLESFAFTLDKKDFWKVRVVASLEE